MKRTVCFLLFLLILSLTACAEKEAPKTPTTTTTSTSEVTTTESTTTTTVTKTEGTLSTTEATATTTATETATTTVLATQHTFPTKRPTKATITTTSLPTLASKPTTETASPKQAAHAKAIMLLDEKAYSYQGLIDTLKHLGFAEDDATSAADTCGADWNKQAARRAQYHLDGMGYGKREIINLLIGEGFTETQIAYALEANNL